MVPQWALGRRSGIFLPWARLYREGCHSTLARREWWHQPTGQCRSTAVRCCSGDTTIASRIYQHQHNRDARQPGGSPRCHSPEWTSPRKAIKKRTGSKPSRRRSPTRFLDLAMLLPRRGSRPLKVASARPSWSARFLGMANRPQRPPSWGACRGSRAARGCWRGGSGCCRTGP